MTSTAAFQPILPGLDEPADERFTSATTALSGIPAGMLAVKTIYHEPSVWSFARAHQIRARFPEADLIEVPSHWQIPQLHGASELDEQWLRVKRDVLVLGVRKSLKMEPNTRSSDFIAPSVASGCASACAYCYVARRKGHANPITAFVNIEAMLTFLARHAHRLGPKTVASPADEAFWVYEIGCNSDTSIDAAISDNVRDWVNLFKTLPNAKGTFATKWVNRAMLDYDPQGKTRVRFSLLPKRTARVLDVRTSPVSARIAAMNEFSEAGYEVNVNFSPVVIRPDFLDDYAELFDELDAVLSPRVKAGLVAEIIFLTHNQSLHEINENWHPRAEELLWRPEIQEAKVSGGGGHNVRYRIDLKQPLVARFQQLLAAKMPYCRVRYAF